MKSIFFTLATIVFAASTLVAGAVVPDSNNKQHAQSEQRRDNFSLKMPIYRHDRRDFDDPDQTMAFAEAVHANVRAKWGSEQVKREELSRRQTIGLTDVGQDSFYVGQVSVGTPTQNFNIILDTGSADFWVVDTSCTSSQCQGVGTFNPSSSSSYTGSQDVFQIQYGSGAVQGTLASDTVSLAGYTVNRQTFAIVDQLAQGTLNAPASGIMGMAFQSLSTSGATPFWQVLAQQGRLADQLFTFQLARVSNPSSASAQNPGGVFTLGTLDANQYSGSVNYVPVTGQAYWTVAMDAFTIGGQTNRLSSNNIAAIDTGTTLLIFPPSVADAVYQQIPGSRTFGGSSSGTYAIPCNTNVALSLTFGGQSYSINSADMLNGRLDSAGTYCLGGILAESLGSGAPGYIIGDVFLKNVFSVYRLSSPASVGFAALKGSSSQVVATSSGAVGTATATAVRSTTAPSSTSVPLVPSISSANTASATGAVQGGSGLPAPVAASTNVVSTPSLIPAGQTASGSGSSAAANLVVPSFVLCISVLLGTLAIL